jgi:hypothetical protein
VRDELTRERLHSLLREIARTAPRGRHRVFVVGGGTAVWFGWRASSVDADLFSEDDAVFRDVQAVKERLNVNVEFSRPEHFVPALPGSEDRHVVLETLGRVSFFHYDPYAQVLAKLVRGFGRDVEDVRDFVASGLVDPDRLRNLVRAIPDTALAKYPSLSRESLARALECLPSSRGAGGG